MNNSLFSVVVADDSEDMRELLAAALHASGRFEVVARATNGQQALAAVAAHQPDLTLLDLGMPIFGGLDVLPDIVAASPSTQVVVVSGFPRERLHELTAARGAVGYVEKSLSVRAMVDEIIAVAGVLDALQAVLASNRTQVASDPRSSAVARRFVRETLERWDCEDLLDTVVLLVSELVTNSVMHARSAADIAVFLTPATLRLEVSDRSERQPARAEADTESQSGRGLSLVEQLSTAWGVEPRAGGKTVWFEVPRPDAVPRVEG